MSMNRYDWVDVIKLIWWNELIGFNLNDRTDMIELIGLN